MFSRRRKEREAEDERREIAVVNLMAEARTQDHMADQESDSLNPLREIYEHHERHALQIRVKAICIHLGIERP